MTIRLLLFALAAGLFSFAPYKKGPGWISIFNGKDLSHWQMKVRGFQAGKNYGNTFRVENGILSIRYDQYDSFNNKFGALYYDRKLSNYRLRVEYRFVGETAKGAPVWGFRDSGIQYHGQSAAAMGIDQPFPISLEYNLHGGNGTEERPVGELCANGIYVQVGGKKNESYCTAPTIRKTFHGDQWVTAEIDIQNGNIRHFVNGEEILAFQNPNYDATNEIAKKLIVDKHTEVKEGYLSLQSNSHPIDFRKIELLEY